MVTFGLVDAQSGLNGAQKEEDFGFVTRAGHADQLRLCKKLPKKGLSSWDLTALNLFFGREIYLLNHIYSQLLT